MSYSTNTASDNNSEPVNSPSEDTFADRRRLLTDREDVMNVAQKIRANLAVSDDALRAVLDEQHPADLADAMFFLDEAEERAVFDLLTPAEAAEVLDEVDDTTTANLVSGTTPDRLADILEELPSDEGADVVGSLSPAAAAHVLSLTEFDTAEEIRALLAYPKDSAGGIMSTGFVDVRQTATQTQALARFREKTEAENIFYVYIVDDADNLNGIVDLRKLLTAAPHTLVTDLMTTDVIAVAPDCDQEQVANIFSRYDLTALPVTLSGERGSKLLGVVTADDIIDVLQEESAEDVAHFSGTDAEELEKKSPVEVARLRLPWILATMAIELLASVVIDHFDATTSKYKLLVAFMPVISAISGNIGLQSAAIVIRGLSTGQVQLTHWKHVVGRQAVTTLVVGGVCAVILGLISGVRDKHWAFGFVVFLGMFMSVNIAGVVGTCVPLLSKRAGFDPALTAGPFETAFQDVVGISIFLSLAAVLLGMLR